MKNILTMLLALCISATNLQAQELITVNPAGNNLLNFYLNMNVENLWIAGHHIDWVTGLPDRPNAEAGIKTHCSAFVAAVCKNKSIYILRPPEHSQILLANAQFQWLTTPAAQSMGWHQIINTSINKTYFAAQQYANNGYVVVAVCQNLNPHKSGHIALIRPTEISTQQLTDEGPTVTMASTKNTNLISLKLGFKSHIKEWPEPAILFFYNQSR